MIPYEDVPSRGSDGLVREECESPEGNPDAGMVRIVVCIHHGTNDPDNFFFFGKKAAALRCSVSPFNFSGSVPRGGGEGFGLDRFVI